MSEMSILDAKTTRIIDEAKGVSHVVCDITSEPLGTIEWDGEYHGVEWDRATYDTRCCRGGRSR
jgi:hypothetical protein